MTAVGLKCVGDVEKDKVFLRKVSNFFPEWECRVSPEFSDGLAPVKKSTISRLEGRSVGSILQQ